MAHGLPDDEAREEHSESAGDSPNVVMVFADPAEAGAGLAG